MLATWSKHVASCSRLPRSISPVLHSPRCVGFVYEQQRHHISVFRPPPPPPSFETQEAIKEVIAFADVHENLPSGTREGYTLRADTTLGASLQSSHPVLATKYPPQPSREEKKKAPLMSHHPNATDDRFSSSTRGSVEDSIPAVYPSRAMDEDGDTAMSSAMHRAAQHPMSPRGALTHAAESSASLPARFRGRDITGHHQSTHHAPRPPMPAISPRGLPAHHGGAQPHSRAMHSHPRGAAATDMQSEGPTRSEFEEAERVIAQFTKPRKLPGSSGHNWMGPLLPVEYVVLRGGVLMCVEGGVDDSYTDCPWQHWSVP